MEKIFNLCSAAAALGVSRQRILAIAHKKGIGHYANRHWTFTEADIEQMRSERAEWYADAAMRHNIGTLANPKGAEDHVPITFEQGLVGGSLTGLSGDVWRQSRD